MVNKKIEKKTKIVKKCRFSEKQENEICKKFKFFMIIIIYLLSHSSKNLYFSRHFVKKF